MCHCGAGGTSAWAREKIDQGWSGMRSCVTPSVSLDNIPEMHPAPPQCPASGTMRQLPPKTRQHALGSSIVIALQKFSNAGDLRRIEHVDYKGTQDDEERGDYGHYQKMSTEEQASWYSVKPLSTLPWPSASAPHAR